MSFFDFTPYMGGAMGSFAGPARVDQKYLTDPLIQRLLQQQVKEQIVGSFTPQLFGGGGKQPQADTGYLDNIMKPPSGSGGGDAPPPPANDGKNNPDAWDLNERMRKYYEQFGNFDGYTTSGGHAIDPTRLYRATLGTYGTAAPAQRPLIPAPR